MRKAKTSWGNSRLRRSVQAEVDYHKLYVGGRSLPPRNAEVLNLARLRKQVLASSFSPQQKAALTRKLNMLIRQHAHSTAIRFGLPWNPKK